MNTSHNFKEDANHIRQLLKRADTVEEIDPVEYKRLILIAERELEDLGKKYHIT